MAKERKFVFDTAFGTTQEEVIINLKISKELQALIPPLTKEEYEKLEVSILSEGCREALIVWKNGSDFILIDGHNRYEICKKHNVLFTTQTKEFSGISDVKDWMINNQLGKRNVTEEVKSYLRGLQYKTEKQKQGQRNDLTFGQNVQRLSTNEKLAQEHKVSAKTIQRDEKFLDNLDKLVGNDTELKWKILNKEVLISKSDLEKITNGEDSQIEKARQELADKGKITLPNTKLVTEKEKKITALFSLFLKTRNPELVNEIYEMMREMI
jgi:ParB-like chromosome segregation protein Spo0J